MHLLIKVHKKTFREQNPFHRYDWIKEGSNHFFNKLGHYSTNTEIAQFFREQRQKRRRFPQASYYLPDETSAI